MGCRSSKADVEDAKKKENNCHMKKDARGNTTSVKYSVDNESSYDPWTFDDKIEELNTPVNEKDENKDVTIIKHSVDKIKNIKKDIKNSECQTDPADSIDFDWDLTEKTDIEIQVITNKP